MSVQIMSANGPVPSVHTEHVPRDALHIKSLEINDMLQSPLHLFQVCCFERRPLQFAGG